MQGAIAESARNEEPSVARGAHAGHPQTRHSLYDGGMSNALIDPHATLVFSVPGFFSPAECRAFIARLEALHPEPAPVSTSRGAVMMPHVRNNQRVMFTDQALADALYVRLAPQVPKVLRSRQLSGVNERFRGYRYDVGQSFAPHYDGSFARNDQERSLLTLMIYLNEEFSGGETRFLTQDLVVVPRTGDALLFQHHVLHEGCTVTAGTKYALRSDVMYRLST